MFSLVILEILLLIVGGLVVLGGAIGVLLLFLLPGRKKHEPRDE